LNEKRLTRYRQAFPLMLSIRNYPANRLSIKMMMVVDEMHDGFPF